jgi:hypothetical protein
MGGDGGVIASSRKYMRGAGTADHTGDEKRNREQTSEKEVVQELLKLCYLTKVPLNFKNHRIVADPYGRLYHKEAVVEALLRRKQQESDELGKHIRGLKDLKTVHFELSPLLSKPICPVTSVELNGLNPAFLLPHRKDGGVNVLSERAMKEMGKEALKEEYGDLADLVRLAPPPSMMEEIQTKVEEQQEIEKAEKMANKLSNKKKRKIENNKGGEKKKKIKTIKAAVTVTDAARKRVQSAVESNDVLSSLFTKERNVSHKQRADNLFSINQA